VREVYEAFNASASSTKIKQVGEVPLLADIRVDRISAARVGGPRQR
jgi:hypothetical protein